MSKQNKELRSLTQKEIEARMVDLRKEMIKVNAQAATGTTPKNPYQIRNSKRTIARILTFRREGELRQALAAQKKPAKAGKEEKQA